MRKSFSPPMATTVAGQKKEAIIAFGVLLLYSLLAHFCYRFRISADRYDQNERKGAFLKCRVLALC